MFRNHFQTIENPTQTMSLAKESYDFLKSRTLTSLLNLECLDEGKPEPEDFEYAANFLAETTSLTFTPENVEWMSRLYPEVRNAMAMYGHGDSTLRDMLRSMASHFYLGCSWPTFGDKGVNVYEFTDLLQQQAVLFANEHYKHMSEDGKDVRISMPTPLGAPTPDDDTLVIWLTAAELREIATLLAAGTFNHWPDDLRNEMAEIAEYSREAQVQGLRLSQHNGEDDRPYGYYLPYAVPDARRQIIRHEMRGRSSVYFPLEYATFVAQLDELDFGFVTDLHLYPKPLADLANSMSHNS